MNRLGLIALIAAAAPGWALAASTKPPPAPGNIREAYVGCHWQAVRGKTLSIWSMACDAKHGAVRLVADDSLPGFVLVSDNPEGKSRHVAIRVFNKAKGAPLSAILPAVRAASPGPNTATCAFAPLPQGKAVDFEPSGAAKAAWAASQKTSTMPDQPCGALGVGYAGDNYFEVMVGEPTKVVYVDMGSEVQIFDPTTLRLVRP